MIGAWGRRLLKLLASVWSFLVIGGVLLVAFISIALDALSWSVLLVGLVSVLLLFLAWWWLPARHASSQKGKTGIGPKELFEFENSTRQTAGQLVTGLVAIVGVYFLWQELNSTNDALRLEEQAQITDRFTDAVAQLESDNGATRLGGIFALEQLARDGRDPNQHWAVVQVLTAFVRDRAPWPTEPATPPPVDPVEVEAVIIVLGRRDAERDPEGQRLDLRGSDLRGVAFEHEAEFRGADFRGANLEGATLNYVHLEQADFRSEGQITTSLAGSDLNYAYLDGAFLDGAVLNAATLIDAGLHEARLAGAFLQCVEAGAAQPDCANLDGADLSGADLSDAHFEGATLTDADWTGVDLNRTRLEGANLGGGTGLPPDELSKACVDGETTLPDPSYEGWGRTC